MHAVYVDHMHTWLLAWHRLGPFGLHNARCRSSKLALLTARDFEGTPLLVTGRLVPRRMTRGCTSLTRVPLKDLRSREPAAAARASAVTLAAAGETAAAAASAGGSSSEGTTNSSASDLQNGNFSL